MIFLKKKVTIRNWRCRGYIDNSYIIIPMSLETIVTVTDLQSQFLIVTACVDVIVIRIRFTINTYL